MCDTHVQVDSALEHPMLSVMPSPTCILRCDSVEAITGHLGGV